ncbi:inhibitor of growth protein 5-like [Rhopalosiphum padi]|uniref:inhibitor of growth protein 5-like n=1 Tax=Rhopalosiphum padi TaxID=40932 RepID=UPI00298DE25E|nr:inhibitor of growth protein 5-like [Rhopalosiphum padi]
MRHIEKKAKEKVRNAHKLQNDFLSRIKVLTTNEKSEYLNSILCLLNEVIEHAEDKVKLAVQTYDEFNENERKLDLGKARLEENIYNRASGAKNIEEGVQQINEIWNKPSTSREEETTPYKISEKKIIQKDVTKMNITATSKTPLVGVIRPTNATNSVYDKVETGPLNGSLDNAGVALSPEESEMPVDSNEQTYCLCKQISYGKMIACDNSCCPIEWFHFECVNVTTEPKGKWLCPKCKTNKMNK